MLAPLSRNGGGDDGAARFDDTARFAQRGDSILFLRQKVERPHNQDRLGRRIALWQRHGRADQTPTAATPSATRRSLVRGWLAKAVPVVSTVSPSAIRKMLPPMPI